MLNKLIRVFRAVVFTVLFIAFFLLVIWLLSSIVHGHARDVHVVSGDIPSVELFESVSEGECVAITSRVMRLNKRRYRYRYLFENLCRYTVAVQWPIFDLLTNKGSIEHLPRLLSLSAQGVAAFRVETISAPVKVQADAFVFLPRWNPSETQAIRLLRGSGSVAISSSEHLAVSAFVPQSHISQ